MTTKKTPSEYNLLKPSSERPRSTLSSNIFSKLLDNDSLSAPERGVGLLVFAEFFDLPMGEPPPGGATYSRRSVRNSRVTQGDDPMYSLPDGFYDWEEWESIVISKLKALVKLRLSSMKPSPKADKKEDNLLIETTDWYLASVIELGMAGKSLPSDQFPMLGNALSKGRDKVSFAELEQFFRRIKERKGYSNPLGDMCELRTSVMIRDWVYFCPESGTFSGLCTLDNTSAAELLIVFENSYRNANADAMESPKNTGTAMTKGNFSRLKKSLGLISCSKPSWKAYWKGSQRMDKR